MATLTKRWAARLRDASQTAAARALQLLGVGLGKLSPGMQMRVVRTVQVAVEVHGKSGEDDVGTRASALSYSTFLSLLPLLAVGLAVGGALLAGRAQELFQRTISQVPGFEQLVNEQAHRLVAGRVGVGLLGLLALLWAGSGLSSTAQKALAAIFRRPGASLTGRIRAVIVTIVLFTLLVSSVAASSLLGELGLHGTLAAITSFLARLLLVPVEFGFFLVAYYLLTPKRALSLRRHIPGALLMTVGWTLLKVLGSVLVSRTIARASLLYGTIGTIFGVLVFLRLTSWLFLYGAELTSVLAARAGAGQRTSLFQTTSPS